MIRNGRYIDLYDRISALVGRYAAFARENIFTGNMNHYLSDNVGEDAFRSSFPIHTWRMFSRINTRFAFLHTFRRIDNSAIPIRRGLLADSFGLDVRGTIERSRA